MVQLLAVLASACASRPDVDTAVSVEGAFSLLSGQGDLAFTVPVSIDGSPELPFIVDTGSTATALYPRAVAALAEEPRIDGRAFVWGIAEAQERPVVRIGEITLGQSRRFNVPAVLLEQSGATPGLAGLVGLDLLDAYAMVWRPETGLLTFIPNDVFMPEAFANWEELRLERRIPEGRSKRLATVTMRMGGRPVPAVVDTGASNSFANWDAVRANPILRLARRRLQRRWEVEGAIGSFEPRLEARFDRLRIGGQDWQGASMTIADLPAFIPEDGDVEPLVILGADFWAAHAFAIDLKGSRLFLRPIPDENKLDPVIIVGRPKT
ncbi:retroviral-like aspartic protease family protein [Parvularcula lutaonensis]|uniref:Retroviral-like aspartic protease family protein n=1 Tax=Parvularcula lutaonensis TaxID=491923 RepID=A0ABV7MET0_9PROT|nr:retroviral-like aspartic protease family protein [Parvularcula lutaonensis]GGY51776.1 hypothetical protein GCM10007148_20880 [Parvularcula lutaonensis]